MCTALKLGFRYSTPATSFSNYTIAKFAGASIVNLKMGSDRFLCSSSSKSYNISLQASSRNAVDDCGQEMDDMATLGQMKSRLSKGVVAKDSKHALTSNLKNDNNDEGFASQDQVMDKDRPAVIKTYAKRKAQGLSERGNLQALNKDLDISGVKTSKRRVKTSSADATLQSMSERELISEAVETKGRTSSRAKRKVETSVTTSNKVSISVDPPVTEPWTVLTHKKPQKGWISYNPKTMRPVPLDTSAKSIKLMSWNVNGLRALLKLEFSVMQLAQRENFDVLCLQETKLQEKDVAAIRQKLLEGYDHSYWSCSVAKLGYSGTAIISRIKPLSVRYGLGTPDHDAEGRIVTVEFEEFYLLSAYVPNSSDGLKRLPYRITQWDPSLSKYIKDLELSKPVILTGDLNCAHQEIDIYNPAGNKRSAGFTDEERQSFQKNFLDNGFVDTFRKQHPDVVGYTYWGYRHGGRKTNKGWRLDYFLASESIADKVYDSYILPDVAGSDYGPIGLILRL